MTEFIPINPASAPEISIETIIIFTGEIPAYFAALSECPNARISYPSFVLHIKNQIAKQNKREIIKLKNVVAQKGLTIVPLKAYFKRGIAKIEFATAKGKKMYQKKEALKIKDLDREASREMRRR